MRPSCLLDVELEPKSVTVELTPQTPKASRAVHLILQLPMAPEGANDVQLGRSGRVSVASD